MSVDDGNPGEDKNQDKNDTPPAILFAAWSVGSASILWIIMMIIKLMGCDCL